MAKIITRSRNLIVKENYDEIKDLISHTNTGFIEVTVLVTTFCEEFNCSEVMRLMNISTIEEIGDY